MFCCKIWLMGQQVQPTIHGNVSKKNSNQFSMIVLPHIQDLRQHVCQPMNECYLQWQKHFFALPQITTKKSACNYQAMAMLDAETGKLLEYCNLMRAKRYHDAWNSWLMNLEDWHRGCEVTLMEQITFSSTDKKYNDKCGITCLIHDLFALITIKSRARQDKIYYPDNKGTH